jgi:hypothetical protein
MYSLTPISKQGTLSSLQSEGKMEILKSMRRPRKSKIKIKKKRTKIKKKKCS